MCVVQTFFHTVEYGTQRTAETGVCFVERAVNRGKRLVLSRGWRQLIQAWASTTLLHSALPFAWAKLADSYFLGPEVFIDYAVVSIILSELGPVLFALHNMKAFNYSEFPRRFGFEGLDKKRAFDRLRNWIGAVLGPNTLERAVRRKALPAGYRFGRHTEPIAGVTRPRPGTAAAARVAEAKAEALRRSQTVEDEIGLSRRAVERIESVSMTRRMMESAISQIGEGPTRDLVERLTREEFERLTEEAEAIRVGASGSGVAQERYRPRPMPPSVEEEEARLSGSEEEGRGRRACMGGGGRKSSRVQNSWRGGGRVRGYRVVGGEEEEVEVTEVVGGGEGEFEGGESEAGWEGEERGEETEREESEGMEAREGEEFIAGFGFPSTPGAGDFGTVPASSAAAGTAPPGFVTDLFSTIRSTVENRVAPASVAGARVTPHVPSHPLDVSSTVDLASGRRGGCGRGKYFAGYSRGCSRRS
jgi:hypothetical protein